MGDIIGRKGTLFTGAFVFTIGGVVQTFTTGFYVMIIGRVISGFGVGLLSWVTLRSTLYFVLTFWFPSTIVPIYQSEISPPNHVCIRLARSKHALNPRSERRSCLHGVHRQHRRLCYFSRKPVFRAPSFCAHLVAPSGLTIFARSSTLIFLGGYPSLFNASLEPSLQLVA